MTEDRWQIARHLPPGAATRHLKWDDDWIDDRGQMAEIVSVFGRDGSPNRPSAGGDADLVPGQRRARRARPT
jgi:hypothetical protein